MEKNECINNYLEKMRCSQQLLLDFFDTSCNIDVDLQNIINNFNQKQILTNPQELRAILHLISCISNNHYKRSDFYVKIEELLQQLKEIINQFYTNDEIFDIFKQNKRILLFLLKEKIIIPDKYIATIISSPKYKRKHYPHFFYPEFKTFFNEKLNQEILNFIQNVESFEEKRLIGENEDFICQLIRNDSVEEFVYNINKENISFSSDIRSSIYETNIFLSQKMPSIIEYSAFYGSINILKYLYLNKVELSPSLWNYAIHGNSSEMIHFLEEIQLKPMNDSYKECFYESIKCHHNELADYFKNNFLNEDDFNLENSKVFKAYNYEFFPEELNDDFETLIELCKYDHFYIVKFLLDNNKSIDINTKKVYMSVFLRNFNLIKYLHNFTIEKFHRVSNK